MEGSGRFERYRILSLLDRGGMGSVHRAHDERLDREIALKIVRGPGDEESRARVLREARAVAALEHPNVVAIYDVGSSVETDDGPPLLFIAMELVRGDSLRSLIGKEDVPLDERVRWLRDIAEALAYAHERGIVHRDVKPENVMIRSDGVVKVLDFGIARRGPVDATSVALPTLTEKGAVLGTPRYMAPEQMLGEDLDGRADQFAWGVVAYEVLAGKPPWNITSDSLQAVAEMLMHPHAPLRDRAPDVPPELEAVVERAIQRARRDRYPTMRDVIASLDEWLASVGAMQARGTKRTTAKAVAAPAVDATNPARRRAIALGVAALGLVLAVGIGVGMAARSRPASASGAAFSASSAASARCSARECTAQEGAPAVCKPDRSCARLASDDCRVVAAPGDENNDRTIWLGAMFPLTGPDSTAFGLREFRAVDLGRTEVARAMSGTNAQADRSRPIALVACDDSHDASRAAHHLVDDVGVPAVIGFRTSQEAIDVATSTLLPNGVLGLSALNTSPVLTHLPQPPGQPRLIWRTAVSATQSAAAAGEVVPRVLEPLVHSHASSPGDIRVALVRQDDPAGRGFADALFRTLAFNGKSAMDNGASFAEVLFPFAPQTGGADAEVPYVAAAGKVAAFAPNVIVYFGSDETFAHVLAPLEKQWHAGSPRPIYLKPAVFGPAIAEFVGRDVSRRRRFFGMTTTSSTIANARFVARYNEAYDDTVTRTFSPNSSYDAFYLLAYAVYAVGDAKVSGSSLSRALAKLDPPGEPIDVGPEGIFPALAALGAGRNVDLNGASGRLDFDAETGESPVDLAILCLGVDEHGAAADSVESGLVLDSAAHALRGTLACP